jgi:hypothetical protein
MFRPLKVVLALGLPGALALSLLALPASAASSIRAHGTARLIDTDVVVGFPQPGVTPGTLSAKPGGGSGRSGLVAPVITTQPQPETVSVGGAAAFSASASGTPTPSVQWEVSTNSGRRWSTIFGATSTTYSFSATASQSGSEYEAVFRNSAGSATTSAATLTVSAASPTPPAITTEPVSESVDAGATATFTAAASGVPTPAVEWSVSTNGGQSFASIPGATSTTYSFSATASQSGDEYEATFTNGTGTAATTAATLTVTVVPLDSSNWSGYADLDASFSAVSASWTVPTVTCPRGGSSYSAEWVGIDGYSSSTVEQDGTEADCINGSPSYDAWFELYGDSAENSGDEIELSPTDGYPLSPGDSITASVTDSGGTWTFDVTDGSKWAFTTSVVFEGASESSAEWIVERPELCGRTCSLTSLANFGSVTFTNASTTSGAGTGTIISNADVDIDMVNGSTLLAVPGALVAGGDSFVDNWQAA